MTTAAKPSIAEALSKVMAAVQGISKNQRVTSGPAQFSFRGVDAVVNVVGPVLREHGVIVVPHAVQEIREERYETSNKKQMHGVILHITWRFYGPAGDFIEAASVGESSDSGDKASPKAHSVAYRTVLLQALCIPTDEPDPDSQVHERITEEEREAQQRAASQQFVTDFTMRIGDAMTKVNVASLDGELRNRFHAGVIDTETARELKALLDRRQEQIDVEQADKAHA